MTDILDYMGRRPWLWLLFAVSTAVWIGGIVAVFRSSKFLRKWLWLLLCLLSFSFSWSVGPGTTLSIGLPLGAAYVLWFARYGPAPTDEERARRAAKTAPPASVSPHRLLVLRVAYGAFAAAIVSLAAWMVFGPIQKIFALAGAGSEFMLAFNLMAGLMTAAFVGLAAFLAWRPYWWGKLLCALGALSWIGHGAMSVFLMPMVLGPEFPAALHGAVVGGCGLIALAAGVAHQWADPRFGGTYLRAA